MAICLLDSGVVIDLLNSKRRRGEILENLIRDGDEMGSCAIVVTEVYSGLRPGEEAVTERLLRSFKFYPITWEIARQAGELQKRMAAQRSHGFFGGRHACCSCTCESLGLRDCKRQRFPYARSADACPGRLKSRAHIRPGTIKLWSVPSP